MFQNVTTWPVGQKLSRALAGAATLLLAAIVLWPARATAVDDYHFMLIEAFNIEYALREVYVRDINEHGIACGTSTDGSYYSGFVWDETNDKTRVPILWPWGINNLGQVVGGGLLYDTASDSYTVIPPVGGYPNVQVTGINDNGVVVGASECNCSNSDHVNQTALIWEPGQGSRPTGVPALRDLVRVNESNIATGNIRVSAGASEAVQYNVDTAEWINLSDLLPPPPFGRPWSEATGINDDGVICGQAYDGTTTRGMIWSESDGFTFLPALGGGALMRVHPLGIGPNATVVGRALTATEGWHAFIWDPVGGMRDLNDLTQADPNFILEWATAINDDGWIVGIGHVGPGWNTSRGFVLKPPAATADAPEIDGTAGLQLALSPNPSRGPIRALFSLPQAGQVHLSMHDASGRVVARLANEWMAAGPHRLEWDGTSSLPAGVYYGRLQTGRSEQIERVVVVR
ncbi:MAG: hypothetical protein R3E12_18435 [Candidatus Eisenbacteria bacterium]